MSTFSTFGTYILLALLLSVVAVPVLTPIPIQNVKRLEKFSLRLSDYYQSDDHSWLQASIDTAPAFLPNGIGVNNIAPYETGRSEFELTSFSGDLKFVSNYGSAEGGYIVYAESGFPRGLRLLNVTDNTNPVFVEGNGGSSVRYVLYADDYVYSVRDPWVNVYSINDLVNDVGFYGAFKKARHAQSGNFFYAVEWDDTIQIYDVTDQAAWATKGTCTFPYGIGKAAVVVGSYLYVVSMQWLSLAIFDVSDENNCFLVGQANVSMSMTFNEFNNIKVVDDIAYITELHTALYIYNVSDKTSPEFISKFTEPKIEYEFHVSGSYVFLPGGNEGIKIINIQNLTNPTLERTYKTIDASAVTVQDNYMYVADSYNGILIVFLGDLIIEGNPKECGDYVITFTTKDSSGTKSGNITLHVRDPEYLDDLCTVYSCLERMSNETEERCGGHGYCEIKDHCTCENGYNSTIYGGVCDTWDCWGHNYNSTSVCSSRGICASADSCLCLNGYEAFNCQTWSCNNVLYVDGKVCSSRGRCLTPDVCTCNAVIPNLHYDVFGKFCGISAGKQLVYATKTSLMLYFEIREELVSTYNIEISTTATNHSKRFNCSNLLRIKTYTAGFHARNNEIPNSKLSSLFNTWCTLSSINEFKNQGQSSQFLRIDISHLQEDEFLDILKELENRKLEIEVAGMDHEVELYPSYSVLLETKQTYTLKSFSESSLSSDNAISKSPVSETEVCKVELFIDDQCIELYECYESISSHDSFEYFSIGFSPDSESNVYKYSKFYFPDETSCERGTDFTEYKMFSTLSCYGSPHGDKFIVYERCGDDLATVAMLFFSENVVTYFIMTCSPVFALVLFLFVFCFCCSENCKLYYCRGCFRCFRIWPCDYISYKNCGRCIKMISSRKRKKVAPKSSGSGRDIELLRRIVTEDDDVMLLSEEQQEKLMMGGEEEEEGSEKDFLVGQTICHSEDVSNNPEEEKGQSDKSELLEDSSVFDDDFYNSSSPKHRDQKNSIFLESCTPKTSEEDIHKKFPNPEDSPSPIINQNMDGDPIKMDTQLTSSSSSSSSSSSHEDELVEEQDHYVATTETASNKILVDRDEDEDDGFEINELDMMQRPSKQSIQNDLQTINSFLKTLHTSNPNPNPISESEENMSLCNIPPPPHTLPPEVLNSMKNISTYHKRKSEVDDDDDDDNIEFHPKRDLDYVYRKKKLGQSHTPLLCRLMSCWCWLHCFFCCCCCICIRRKCVFGCICELMKTNLMIFGIILKEGFSLWFASSEFLESDDIDVSNKEYVLLNSIMSFNQYIIWGSIFVYLSFLLVLIIGYVGRFILDPFLFSIGFGSLKEFVYFRIVKASFLLWFMCINLFCYITKFAYLSSHEQWNALSRPSFWMAIVFPELLLLFSLTDVLSYNGVSSHAHLVRLRKLGICRLYKFPKVKIGFTQTLKDADVILEDFFQLIFLLEKKRDEEDVVFLHNSNDMDVMANRKRRATSKVFRFQRMSTKERKIYRQHIRKKKKRKKLSIIEDLSSSYEYGHLSWEFLDGLSFDEIMFLKQFFFPKRFCKESYITVFHHHRIASRKWLFAFLLFPYKCIFGC